MKIDFSIEHVLDSLPRRRYDFQFTHNNRSYLVEFDGEQHFRYVPFFHNYDEKVFEKKKRVDILKTLHAYKGGYRLIRIDYTQIDRVREHIEKALHNLDDTYTVYWSNVDNYNHMITSLMCQTRTDL